MYNNPLFPLSKMYFIPINAGGGGGGGLDPCVSLSYASDSGAARICQRGPKRGSEATGRGEGMGGGFSPSHGREIFFFENLCMKIAFACDEYLFYY